MTKDAQLERLIEARELALSNKKAAQKEVRLRQSAIQSFAHVKNKAFQTREETKITLSNTRAALADGHDRIDPLLEEMRSATRGVPRGAHEEVLGTKTTHRLRKPQRTKKHLREAKRSRALRAHGQGSLRSFKYELTRLHARHKKAESAHSHACAAFLNTQQHFKALVEEKEVAQRALDNATQAAAQADQDYQERLKELQLFYKAHSADLARQAGVPIAYIESTLVAYKPDGSINLYFGGEGRPDGEHHGHYTLNPEGRVSYRRDPYQKKGSHNFIQPAP